MKLFVTGGSGFIGVNFVRDALERGDEVINYSVGAPCAPGLDACWVEGDIMDAGALGRAVREFAPDAVVHLAARTDCDEMTTVEAGYRANTDGTANLLAAVGSCGSVRRLVVTSSQFVCGPGRMPAGDEDYFPHTVYGQSKVITEKLTRSAGLDCAWTIIRPTNIWGPWHPRYAEEIWRVIRRGCYVHPGGGAVVRSYGYVGNVVWQIRRILALDETDARGKTYYVGDRPGDIYAWTNAFSLALIGKPVRKVPRPLLRLLALAGDGISLVTRRPFLINSSRYRSMITDYVPPIEPTFRDLGEPPFTLGDGVAATVEWIRMREVET